MLDSLETLLRAAPEMALFITIALGYLVGKVKVGSFVLGGVAGTLLMGVLMGQLDIHVDPRIKGVFFALFLYAVGYQGGPQFFRSLNRRSLNELASAFMMAFVGLLVVLGSAWAFGLDRGTAAGLAAGGLTQSAIIGTAGETIAKLQATPAEIQQMQANLAVGYAICYIFGSLGPIVMITWFFPTIMRWDVRQAAVDFAKTMSGGGPELEPGQLEGVRHIDTRTYAPQAQDKALGQSVAALDAALSDAAVEGLVRNGETISATPDLVVQPGDLLIVTGRVEALEEHADLLGREVPPPPGAHLVLEQREIILTDKALVGKSLQTLHDEVAITTRRGIFLTAVRRLGRELPLLPGLELHRGDELQLTGGPKDIDRVQAKVGYKITAAAVTDFVFFGLGMALGILLGMGEVKVAGVPVTLGTGGGCLFSGLLFGWLRSVHPHFAALPSGASNFLRDFGLAVFVGVVGISAGPQALASIQANGMTLFLLGVAVTLVPMIVVFYFSYYVLRIQNPIEALACLAGGRSANPAFAALLSKAGNATPVVAFTITYAIANVFLTLWGPLIVGIITKNPPTGS